MREQMMCTPGGLRSPVVTHRTTLQELPNGRHVLQGLAAPVRVPVRERDPAGWSWLEPGCFRAALRSDRDRITAQLFRHGGAVIGRCADGSLELWEDSLGLEFLLHVPANDLGRQLVDAWRRDEITGASICYEIVREHCDRARLPDGRTMELVTEALGLDHLAILRQPCKPAWPQTRQYFSVSGIRA